jgi:methylated-DNA-protein-cysteine methyltransferase-like protein
MTTRSAPRARRTERRTPPARPFERRSRRVRETPAPATRGSYPRVYDVVMRIPRGRVATYGQVAAQAGLPHAPRVAGYALHALPSGSPVPWHRVVAAGGRLSLGRLDPSGALTQRMRLEHEGVRFDARGCVDLERFQWRPRSRTAAKRRSSR